jgi:hypothetical protein
MTNKQKKENKLTFLNHLLAPTFLAQNPHDTNVSCLLWVAPEFTKLVLKEKNLFAQ